jgi:hypothetical protein
MESMNHSIQEQTSTEPLREQIQRAVAAMNEGDLSHVEVDGILVVDADAADLFLNDPRYSHIGSENVDGDTVQVFLFVSAE